MVLYIEPCEAVSELEVFLGQSSDVWNEIPIEMELCCRIRQSLKKKTFDHRICSSGSHWATSEYWLEKVNHHYATELVLTFLLFIMKHDELLQARIILFLELKSRKIWITVVFVSVFFFPFVFLLLFCVCVHNVCLFLVTMDELFSSPQPILCHSTWLQPVQKCFRSHLKILPAVITPVWWERSSGAWVIPLSTVCERRIISSMSALKQLVCGREVCTIYRGWFRPLDSDRFLVLGLLLIGIFQIIWNNRDKACLLLKWLKFSKAPFQDKVELGYYRLGIPE